MTTKPKKSAKSSTSKQNRPRFASDKKFLNNLISILEKGTISKENLAKELGVENVNSLTDKVFLAAVMEVGNTEFMKNLIIVPANNQKNLQYIADKGLLIPKKKFEGKNIKNEQWYKIEFVEKEDNGKINTTIILHPTDNEVEKEENGEINTTIILNPTDNEVEKEDNGERNTTIILHPTDNEVEKDNDK